MQKCPDFKSHDENGDNFTLLEGAGIENVSPSETFLCEQEDDRACPPSYLSHGATCIGLMKDRAKAGEAELRCQEPRCMD